jgi:hypothetical protein
MAFDGFTDKDFDTYQPAHRTSAMYTLARRQVREKLKGLLTELVTALGADVAGMELVLSSDAPSLENNRSVSEQSGWLIRGVADKEALKALVEKLSLKSSTALDVATHHKHAALGVAIDNEGFRCVLRYHGRGQVDRQNLRAKLVEGWAQDALLSHFKALDDGFRVTLPGAEGHLNPLDLTLDHILGMTRVLDGDQPLEVVRQRIRDDAKADLPKKAVDDLRALVPLYKFGAWAPDADYIQAVKAAKQQRQEARKATQLQPGDKVRILTGMWNGKSGVVEAVDKKGLLRVQVGQVTVKVDAKDAAPF